MKKKYLTEEWREVIKQMVWADCFKDQPDTQAYIDFIEQLIKVREDKAREDGYEKGVEDGMKGKVFNKVEIKEEAHIPKKLIDKIWEKGYRAGMADVRKIGEIYKILETKKDE